MREYQIQIEPFEYTAVRDIKITRTVNEHAVASVTVQIRDGREEEYLDMLTGEAWVRIIGAGGQLVGYTGGLEIKRFLLRLEERLPG